MIQRFFACSIFTCLSIALAACAEDWPGFRGPTEQGLAEESRLPVEWSTTKNVTWKQQIPGKGWSSPIVVEGKVYLTTAVPSNQNDFSLKALCLEGNSGKILWGKEVFREDGASAPPVHGKNSHASPTPLIKDGRLYVHFGHQGTACLDLDGNIVWQNNDFRYHPMHGNGGSPILVDDHLIFSCDGRDERFLVALHKNDGKPAWKIERQGEADRKFSFSTPLCITVKSKKQIISPGSNMVAAYDPMTGREIWRVRYDGYSVIPRPVFGHGLVYICTGYGLPSLLAIRPDGEGDVTDSRVVWQTNRGVPHTSSILLVGDEIYMVSDKGRASCLDAKTGKVHWQETIGGDYSASPIYGGGKIYFQSEDGKGIVVEAGKKFELIAKNDLQETSLASYAAWKGTLFVRTEKHLYRIEER